MRTAIKIAAIAAVCIGAADLANGQGVIRRTGEAAANVTRGVVEGTANVARGVGNAAVGTVRATGDAVGLTPATPYQARGGFDNGRDARWRFARHNNQWWYYTPQNQWMYHQNGDWQSYSQDSYQATDQQLAQGQPMNEGQHTAGYRGVEQGQFDQGMHHGQVRHDQHGRAFICENGRPVYLDEGQSTHGFQDQGYQGQSQMSPTPAEPQQIEAARQDLDQQGVAPETSQPQAEGQQSQSLQSAPAASAPTTSGAITGDTSADVSSAPAGPTAGSQAQGDVAAPREINNNPTSQTNGATDNPSR